ncbi:MAG: hypothetical protein P8J17_02280 [Halioglobus sp.]|nr:hypothetical protein [Halioglobus sp.]
MSVPLTGYAITDPILATFGANPEIFYFYNVKEPSLIVLFAIFVAFFPALFLRIQTGLAKRVHAGFAGKLHNIFVGALTAIPESDWSCQR